MMHKTPRLPVGLLTTALSIAGCSKDSPAEKPGSYQATTARAENYPKKCLATTTCTPPQQIAAVYDYAGEVYGKSGRFDGRLTSQERSSVQQLFGPLRSPQLSPLWLQQAQRIALQDFHIEYPSRELHCWNAPYWKLLTASDPRWGEAYVIVGAHHCFQQFQALMTQVIPIEQEIALSPNEWLFLIELSREAELAKEQGKDIRQDEVALFYFIADHFKIPVENPLLPIDSSEVIQEANRQGLSPLELAVDAAIMQVTGTLLDIPQERAQLDALSPDKKSEVAYDLLEAFFNHRLDEHPHIQRIRSEVERAIKVRGSHADAVFSAARKRLKLPEGRSRGQHHDNIHDAIEERNDTLIEISNHLSVARVRMLLKKYGKKKLFFQSGLLHLPIIQAIYQHSREIPIETD